MKRAIIFDRWANTTSASVSGHSLESPGSVPNLPQISGAHLSEDDKQDDQVGAGHLSRRLDLAQAPATRVRKCIRVICTAAIVISSDFALADSRADRGRLLLTQHCSKCHAVGLTDQSPLLAAPPFRRITERLDGNELLDRLREGLSSGHRDMPRFRFSSTDAHAIRSYLNSIRQ
jgi:cytochrome c